MHPARIALFSAVLLVPCGHFTVYRAQEPAPPAAPSTADSSSSAHRGKNAHANEFVVRGTVFKPQGLAFPSVKVSIRRTGERKFLWQGYTNSRGEFAARVPQGAEYEVIAQAKMYAEITRQVDARNGALEQGMVFRMEPSTGGKK